MDNSPQHSTDTGKEQCGARAVITAAMEYAIESRDPEAMLRLLENGADPNSISEHKEPILIEAISWIPDPEIRASMVSLLLRFGADPQWVDDHGDGALLRAVIHKDARVIRLLTEHGADCRVEVGEDEPLFDWAYVDYLIDSGLFGENYPGVDLKDVDARLEALKVEAARRGTISPDYLIELRRAHGYLSSELKG